MSINSIGDKLGNAKFANFAKGTAGAVYVMTVIKAVGRPYFICKDKNSDENTKKYAATSEFLYQLICLGITVAMIPFFKTGGLKLAEKYLKNDKDAAKVLGEVSKVGIFKRASAFAEKYKEVKHTFEEGKPQSKFGEAMAKGNGGIELGAFVGSVIGLTLLAPPISHAIVHPIMKAIGMDKKEESSKKLDRQG